MIRSLYIHLLDGRPAYFNGHQLQRCVESVPLRTLDQVQLERQADLENRGRELFTNDSVVTQLPISRHPIRELEPADIGLKHRPWRNARSAQLQNLPEPVDAITAET